MLRPRPQAGFTLLELVVVLLLVGVILGLAVVGITARPASNALKDEALRLHQLTQLAAESAIIYGDAIGMVVGRAEYGFLVATEAGWQPLPDEVFRPRALDDAFTLELYGEGLSDEDTALAVNTPDREEDDDDGEDKPRLQPQVLFMGTGEATPFEVVLKHADTDVQYKMTARTTGAIDLARVEPDDN